MPLQLRAEFRPDTVSLLFSIRPTRSRLSIALGVARTDRSNRSSWDDPAKSDSLPVNATKTKQAFADSERPNTCVRELRLPSDGSGLVAGFWRSRATSKRAAT